MKSVRKGLVVLTAVLLLGLAACDASSSPPGSSASSKPAPSNAASSQVTIRFFSNLPDRTSGQGRLEQIILDNYMAANPNVKIEIESLQDEPYKQKFQTYVAGNNLPDIFNVWGQPSFFEAVMEKGYVAELNPADYADYGFSKGATEDFSYDGKLYGLPRNQDMPILYINRSMFGSNGIKIPATYNELLVAAAKFRAKRIQPLAINGKDKWILSLFFQDLEIKVSGNQETIYNACDQKTKFADNSDIRKTAELFKQLVDAGLFEDSFTSIDYTAAQNLFLQEQTPMFYMGSWEIGMASNTDNSEHFRENVDIIPFPVVDGGKGKVTDICTWNGGGYAVSAASPVKEEAIRLLNYMMKPENWVQIGWHNGLVVPGQDYSKYLTGRENILQKRVTSILQTATSISGISWNDYLPGDWKTNNENLIQEYAAGSINADEFLTSLDEAASGGQ